ncbi:MAG: hypothetical protein DRJ42_13935 [Deltaproteobacteria bacterium]|nr:MAG: hypothetical protein DRJ42_13935 [Deltaproteobacteria bacterium]
MTLLAVALVFLGGLVGCDQPITRELLVTRAIPAADGTWLWLGQVDVLDTPGGGDAGTDSGMDAGTIAPPVPDIPGDAWIARISGERVVHWQLAVGSVGTIETAEAILELRDSRIAVVGTAPGVGGHDAWLLLLEARGAVSLQQTLGGPGDERFVELIDLPNGDLVAIGTAPGADGTPGLLAARITVAGDVVWSRVATVPGATRVRAVNVLRRSDDRLIVVGALDVGTGDRGLDLWVLTFDFDGNLEWQRTLGTAGDADPARAVLTEDLGLVIASRVVPTGPPADPTRPVTGDLWVLRADRGGTVVWQRYFQKVAFDETPRFVVLRDDGRVNVISSADGFGTRNAGDEDVWLVELDPDGEVLSQRRIASFDVDRAVNAFEKDDDTLEITGVVDGRPTSWTIKDDGTLLAGCGTVADTDATLIDTALQARNITGLWENTGLTAAPTTAAEGRPPALEPLVCRSGP